MCDVEGEAFPKLTAKRSSDSSDQYLDELASSERPAGDTRGTPPASATGKSSGHGKNGHSDDDGEGVVTSDGDAFTSEQIDNLLGKQAGSHDDSALVGNKSRAKVMHSSMVNALWNGLNSAEPSSSAILLRHSAAFHLTLPNLDLSRKTFKMMMTGPQNEGISYRDPNRMELAYDYMRLCLASSHRLDVGPNITSFAPSCWEDVQHILAQPLEETKQMGTFHSIKESVSTSSMRRLGEALHTAASGLSCIDELLKDELSDGKEAGTTSNPKRLYKANPTVRTVLDANAREALKVAVRYAAQCWVRHGHLVLGDGDDLLPAESADEDWCAMEAKRCLDSLGSIISHLAWLYCAEEMIELSDGDCSNIIFNIFENEMSALRPQCQAFDKLQSWEKFRKACKAWFVFSLRGELRDKLKELLLAPATHRYSLSVSDNEKRRKKQACRTPAPASVTRCLTTTKDFLVGTKRHRCTIGSGNNSSSVQTTSQPTTAPTTTAVATSPAVIATNVTALSPRGESKVKDPM